jgi:hypothetical protein
MTNNTIFPGNVGIGTNSPLAPLHIGGTDAICVPSGTTAQRPTGTNTELTGSIRYNTDTYRYEGHGEGRWINLSDSNPPPSWSILMRTGGTKIAYGGTQQGVVNPTQLAYGNPGISGFTSVTASSTGADGRTALGDGIGVYDAFFNKTNITKIALVSGDGQLNDPTSHTHYLVYDLVNTGTDFESIYTILKRLDAANIAAGTQSAGVDSVWSSFSAASANNFTTTHSGLVSATSGTLKTNRSASPNPDKFCIWGINLDADNDCQTLCAYSGLLTDAANIKGDGWRYQGPVETAWSYWGSDFNSSRNARTISNTSGSTLPGIPTNSPGPYILDLYLLGFGP